jgi:hypothetical protein
MYDALDLIAFPDVKSGVIYATLNNVSHRR